TTLKYIYESTAQVMGRAIKDPENGITIVSTYVKGTKNLRSDLPFTGAQFSNSHMYYFVADEIKKFLIVKDNNTTENDNNDTIKSTQQKILQDVLEKKKGNPKFYKFSQNNLINTIYFLAVVDGPAQNQTLSLKDLIA